MTTQAMGDSSGAAGAAAGGTGGGGAAAGGGAALDALLGTSGAGSGAGAAGDGGQGAAGEAADAAGSKTGGEAGGAWWDGFNLSSERPDSDTLADADWLKNKNFSGPDKLIEAYRNLEKAKPLLMPKGPDDVEGKRAVLKALGVPEDAKGYTIPVPDGEDRTFADAFGGVALELGLLPEQAEGLAKWFNDTAAPDVAAQAEAAKTMLRDEWGGDFDRNQELARRGVDRLKLDQGAVAKIASGFGIAETVKLFASIGRGMSEAGGLPGGTGGGFAKTPEQLEARKQEILASPDLQAKLMKGDPSLKAEWAAINTAEGEQMKATYQS